MTTENINKPKKGIKDMYGELLVKNVLKQDGTLDPVKVYKKVVMALQKFYLYTGLAVTYMTLDFDYYSQIGGSVSELLFEVFVRVFLWLPMSIVQIITGYSMF